jgi:hypothetical protein
VSSQEARAATGIDRNGKPLVRYAVIDLAVVKPLRAPFTEKRTTAVETLLSWSFDKKLLAVGPWLVRLSDAPEVTNTLADYGRDVPWGYYVSASVDLLTLRKSLRRYNLVQIPGTPGKVLFRYWDPRVMATFLKVITEFQRERLFEWIDYIEVGGERHFGNRPKDQSYGRSVR